ncbi:alpha/beta hydrolase [Candidatus Parcubacteria bacterium]|nr:alpha/beta hydrolase [Candidatus Parcubacteria bacterium]
MSRQKLIILHGWKSSSDKWQKVKTILESQEQGIKVFALDLPGFKPENKLTKPWSLDDYVEWLAETRSPQAFRDWVSAPFYLLGHSFGGRIALKFALKYPELLKGLVLVSSAGIKDKSLKAKILNLVAKIYHLSIFKKCPLCHIGRNFFYRFVLRRSDYLKTDNDLNLKETMKMALKEDLLPLLPKIKTKTLLVWGDKDKLTPLKQGKLMQAKIPNSQLVILEGLSHTPYLENPKLLSQKILSFLTP